MDWFEPVRAYCERTGPDFWAEPVNAVSNGAFLAAAGVAAWRAGEAPRPDPACLALAGLCAVVGLGSFLFHTVAQRWSLVADVVPIALFIHAYFYLAMTRFLGLRVGPALAATAAFAGFGQGLSPALDALTGTPVSGWMNGSIDYLPAALALLGVAAALRSAPTATPAPLRRRTAGRLIGVASLFLVSLGLRTVDRAACAWLPLGTHALWHVLNAGVLFGLVEAARLHRLRGRPFSCEPPGNVAEGAPRGP